MGKILKFPSLEQYLAGLKSSGGLIEIKKDTPKRPKKDNSKRGDIFLNCRCCGVLIRPDWYSQIDKRYCADCF